MRKGKEPDQNLWLMIRIDEALNIGIQFRMPNTS